MVDLVPIVNKMKSDDFVVMYNAIFDQNIAQNIFNMESHRVIDMHNADLTRILPKIFNMESLCSMGAY